MAVTAKKVVDTAKNFLGTMEKPAGSNNVIFNTHFYGREVKDGSPSAKNKYPWCCTFVWDVFRLSGASDLFYDGKKTDYVPTVEDWGKKNKLTIAKTLGEAGDLITFDWNHNNIGDHIGIIIARNSDGTYQTIEGNTSITSNDNGGKVMERKRYLSDINLIIRPKYVKDLADVIGTPVSSTPKTFVKGQAVKLNSAPLYASSSSIVKSGTKTGQYYIYDGLVVKGRYRITNLASNCGKKPAVLYVTGWVNKGDLM